MTDLIYFDKPVHIFGRDIIEDKAIGQLMECMSNSFVLAGSGMPDMHLGYTMPIGGVVQTDRFTLVPSWVGYDIGCGVMAIRTTFDAFDIRERAENIFKGIYNVIPTGRNWHTESMECSYLDGVPASDWLLDTFNQGGAKQPGTLGSGNHFIEIGVGEDERVWIVVHSGSRNLGHKTASRYIAEACGQATGIYKQKEGSHPLVIGTEAGDDYLKDLTFCQEFAILNRRTLAQEVVDTLQLLGLDGDVEMFTMINKNHNCAELSVTPHGTGYIHRKGATNASEDTKGVIPSNMRDGTFIVKGRGAVDSLFSASHGAGRTGSRKQAKLDTSIEEFENSMGGIMAKVNASTLDENPNAYKDINVVMEAQKDLVEVVGHIKPIINIKA